MWLTSEEQIPTIPGFSHFAALRTGAARASGGTVAYVAEWLSNGVTQVMCPSHPDILWLRVDPGVLGLEQPLFIAFVYIPPRSSAYYDPDVWEALCLSTWELSGKGFVMVVGDLNAHVPPNADDGCDGEILLDLGLDPEFCTMLPPRKSKDTHPLDAHGRELLGLCHSSPLVVLNGRLEGDIPAEPTREKTGAVLDYFLGDMRLWPFLDQLQVMKPLGLSDHSLVTLSLVHMISQEAVGGRTDPVEPRAGSVLRWEPAMVSAFQQNFSRILEEGGLQQQIDGVEASTISEVVTHLHASVKQAAQKAGMHVSSRVRTRGAPRCAPHQMAQPWFDAHCSLLRRRLRWAQRRFGTHDPLVRQRQREYVSFLRKQKRMYRATFAARLNRLHDSKRPGEFWKLFASRPSQGPRFGTPEDWAEYFEGLLNVAETDGPLPDAAELTQYLFLTRRSQPLSVPPSVLESEVSCDEVRKALNKLRNGRAVGQDGIPVEVYKCLSAKLVPFFTKVFNTLIELRFFPAEWSISIITPIFKSGDPRVRSNYRGVSVITALSKWFARVMDIRLSDFAESNGLRAATQAGFRHGYTTFDQLLILQSVFNKFVKREKGVCHRVYCCFIDFKKAYDLVIWERLWERLLSMGIPEKIVSAIRAYYEGAQACVKSFGGLSPTFSLSRGVKQGCPLSCTLFGLFIDAIHEMLCARMAKGDLEGWIPDAKGTPLPDLLFADDSTLLALDPQTLQALLKEIEQFCSDWGMIVNVAKTKVVVFRKGEDSDPIPRFTLSGQEVEVVQSFKYLGLHFHCTKGIAGSPEPRLAAARKATFALNQKCTATGIHNPAILCNLFRVIVMPVLFYGAQVSFPFWTRSQLEEADRLFKRFMKASLGVPLTTPDYFVYGEIAQFPISAYPLGWVVKYWNKIWAEVHRSHLTFLVVSEDWDNFRKKGWASSWVAKSMNLFSESGLNLGHFRDRLIPDPQLQIEEYRNRFQRAWEQRGDHESTYHLFYRRIKPEWEKNRSLWIPDKKLRITLTRFRAGCYPLNAGPRHGHQHLGSDRSCPCCGHPRETMDHFFFHCTAYDLLRRRFGLHRFGGSITRLFNEKRCQTASLARFIAHAWGIRGCHLSGG